MRGAVPPFPSTLSWLSSLFITAFLL